jgi:nucleoside-diphosphate-sugar epimerase
MKRYDGKKVLVIGGMGFIGSNVSHTLVREGAKVTIMDNQFRGLGSNEFNLKGIEKKVKIDHSDILSFDSLLSIVQGFDVIYNFAGQPMHNLSLENPFLDRDLNSRGHLNLLEACKRKNPSARVLYAGSRMQIGQVENLPVDESHPCKPKSPYGNSKLAAENDSLYYYRENGLFTVVFRIANPYGPRSQMKTHKYCIVNWFLGQLMQEKDITMFGDGEQLRDYIYIDDLSNAFLLAGIQPNLGGEVFNVGSGEGTSFRTMMDTLVTTVGKGRRIDVSWPDDYKNIETGDYVSDITKAKKFLGWEPKISFDEGINLTHEFYKEHGQHYF